MLNRDEKDVQSGLGPDNSLYPGNKVELPVPIRGYVSRLDLEARCRLTARRLTVLSAAGGFGKTTLLGHCCRGLREQGVAVAWLSLDERDGPDSVARLLVHAFEQAGVESFGAEGAGTASGNGAGPVPEAANRAEFRIGVLIRALKRHGAPCVLALDEVERLRSRASVALINTLLHRAPGNLHVGMAYRERPPGLEVSMLALEGRAEVVTVEELRFSPPDVSRFFARRLSRRELATVIENSAGWPIALCIYRDCVERGVPDLDAVGGGELVEGWIETRLWRGFSEQDRELLLDVALFEWIEPAVIEEAGVRDAHRRLASLAALSGLFTRMGRRGSTMQLHPMIREYCEKRRFEETPERFRSLHRAIAEVLARRSRTVESLRHAAQAGDAYLLGRLAERAGGAKLWLEEGTETLREVDRLLSWEIVWQFPRLALLRCVERLLSGDIAAMKRIYRDAVAQTAGFTQDRAGGDDVAIRVEHLLVQGMSAMFGCQPFAEALTESLPAIRAVAEEHAEPLLRGTFALGNCMMYNQRTEFATALQWADRARAGFGPSSPYLAHVDLQVGSVLMATGRGSEAKVCYQRALKVARAGHLREAGTLVLGRVLSAELEFELSAGAAHFGGEKISLRLLGECGAWLDIYAAYAEMSAEQALLRGGLQQALATVDQAHEYALHTERTPLARLLWALRVSVLVTGGEDLEADRAWRAARLPEDDEVCIDLSTRSWREAEMLACARLRLLTAQGRFDTARALSQALLRVAVKRRLLRTTMRGLALSITLEHRAGNTSCAWTRLVEYLRLYEKTGYGRPLARERTAALAVCGQAACMRPPEAGQDNAVRRFGDIARDLLAEETGASPVPLSEREMDVLVRLEDHRDMDIAEALNLSYDGLRYRIHRIFTKLGADNRYDAVQRARAQGLLPPAQGKPSNEASAQQP